MELLVCIFITFKSFEVQDNEDNGYDTFSTWCAYISLFVLIVIPIIMIFRLFKIKDRLTEEGIAENNSIILQDLKLLSVWHAAYHIIYLIRRSTLVLSLVAFDGYVVLQMFINIYTSQFYQIFLGNFRPNVNKTMNRMDLMNELGIFIMCICFLLMCDSKYDLPAK